MKITETQLRQLIREVARELPKEPPGSLAAEGLTDWRSGDELNERRVDPAGDAARTLATGLTTAEEALAALERRAARVEGLDTAKLGKLRDHLTGARGALEALGLLSKRG